MPLVLREPRFERFARFLRSLCFMPAPEVRDAMHMDIHTYTFVLAPGGTHAKICHLRPNAWKFHKFLSGGRDVRVVLITQDSCRLLNLFRLVVVETDGPNKLVQPLRRDDDNVFQVESTIHRGCWSACILFHLPAASVLSE